MTLSFYVDFLKSENKTEFMPMKQFLYCLMSYTCMERLKERNLKTNGENKQKVSE